MHMYHRNLFCYFPEFEKYLLSAAKLRGTQTSPYDDAELLVDICPVWASAKPAASEKKQMSPRDRAAKMRMLSVTEEMMGKGGPVTQNAQVSRPNYQFFVHSFDPCDWS